MSRIPPPRTPLNHPRPARPITPAISKSNHNSNSTMNNHHATSSAARKSIPACIVAALTLWSFTSCSTPPKVAHAPQSPVVVTSPSGESSVTPPVTPIRSRPVSEANGIWAERIWAPVPEKFRRVVLYKAGFEPKGGVPFQWATVSSTDYMFLLRTGSLPYEQLKVRN